MTENELPDEIAVVLSVGRIRPKAVIRQASGSDSGYRKHPQTSLGVVPAFGFVS